LDWTNLDELEMVKFYKTGNNDKTLR